MRKPLLLLVLLPIAASAQANQNFENYFLFGPAFASNETIGGSNVTVSGSTGFSDNIGFAFQAVRWSAATLWVEPFPVIIDAPGWTASVRTSSSGSGTSVMAVPAARFMVPVHPRVSFFGALGGGGGKFANYTLTSDIPPQLKTHSVYHGVVGAGGGVDFRISRHISIRVDARDYVTGRGLGGDLGRNHFLPMLGLGLHY
jgi:hypothetical protein